MSENVTIDLTNYKDRMGSRVPPGRYRVVVEDAELDTARSGNKMINLFLRVIDGDFKDSTVTDRLVQTEKVMFRTVDFMNAIGLPTPRKRLSINLSQFQGKIVEVDLDDGEPFNGRVKSEVRGYSRVAMQDQGDLEDVVPGEPTLPATDDGAVPASDVDLNNLGDL